MVKFSKQLELQLVPEWKSAFCNYWKLKKDLKLIKFQADDDVDDDNIIDPPYGNFGYPLRNIRKRLPTNSNAKQQDVIRVHHRKCNNTIGPTSIGGHSVLEIYETQVLEPYCVNKYEVAFFASVDAELNKVNAFYGAKEDEFAQRLETLKCQLHTLVDLRTMMAYTSATHNMVNNNKRGNNNNNNTAIDILDLSSPSSTTSSTSACSSSSSSPFLFFKKSLSLEKPLLRPIASYKQTLEDNDTSLKTNDVDLDTTCGNNKLLPILDATISMQHQTKNGLITMNKNTNVEFNNASTKEGEEHLEDLALPFSSCIDQELSVLRATPTQKNNKHLIMNNNQQHYHVASNNSFPLKRLMTCSTPKVAIHMASTIGAPMRCINMNTNVEADHHQHASGSSSLLSKKRIKYARKMLRGAFVEYYRGLGLLKSFSSLNMLAFGKILKKYDKVTGRNASPPYLKALERSRLNSSDKVSLLMEEAEKLFTQHFAKDDHKKAMMLLRPIQQKVCHTITYFVGLFTGWSLAFLASFIILLHVNGVHYNGSHLQSYAGTMYPIYSLLFLMLLHMYMYGWNVYLWRQVRINYPFIFEFAPSTELRNREILLVCTSLTTLVVASMVCHLIIYFGATTPFNPDFIPFAAILAFLTILLCPLNICYRSSRVFFLRCLKRIILAPFCKVVMADFFLADQLTSQVAAIRSTQHVACYFLGGHFLNHSTESCGGPNYHQIAYVLSFLPYWWRLLQCLRRWFDEGDRVHLANGCKYLSAMIAVGSRLTYQFNPSMAWFVIFIITSSLATIYQMYWDIVMDWGLLQPNSKNPWLRDQLILKNKCIYFISMGINLLLRLAWVQSLSHFQFGVSEHYLFDFFFAALEIMRRGHWNFYRLENEHLNNVGKYRAVKTVPLPFSDDFIGRI